MRRNNGALDLPARTFRLVHNVCFLKNLNPFYSRVGRIDQIYSTIPDFSEQSKSGQACEIVGGSISRHGSLNRERGDITSSRRVLGELACQSWPKIQFETQLTTLLLFNFCRWGCVQNVLNGPRKRKELSCAKLWRYEPNPKNLGFQCASFCK